MIGIFESDNGTKAECRKKLEKFQETLPEEIRKRLDMVWDKIWNDAIMLCPIETGALAASIKVIEGGMGGFLGGIVAFPIYDKTIVAGDIAVTNPKTNIPTSEYALLVHDGHPTKGGGFVSANPFLLDALRMNEAELMEAVDEAMKMAGQDYEAN